MCLWSANKQEIARAELVSAVLSHVNPLLHTLYRRLYREEDALIDSKLREYATCTPHDLGIRSAFQLQGDSADQKRAKAVAAAAASGVKKPCLSQ